MATVATMTVNERAIQQRQSEYERGRRGRRLTSPTKESAPGEERSKRELPRAASYTYIPEAKERTYNGAAIVELKGLQGTEYAAVTDNDADSSPPDTSSPNSSGWNTPEEHKSAVSPPQAQDIVDGLQKKSDAFNGESLDESARSSLDSSLAKSAVSLESARPASTVASTTSTKQRPPVIKSFSRRFSRQSFPPPAPSESSSRSPSPVKQANGRSTPVVTEIATAQPPNDKRRRSFLGRRVTTKTTKHHGAIPSRSSSPENGPEKAVRRRSTVLRKKSVQAETDPDKTTAKQSTTAPPVAAKTKPVIPSLPKSFSTDRLPVLRSQSSSATLSGRAAPVPRLVSSDKAHHESSATITKKKDELWSVFRALDADFAKFSAKSTALKANVVRNALMPFLRTYRNHPSNKTLRLEDLDRRASIFNKWWIGLIEMLHGRNNQSISGTDRPVILEGVTGIMERPEWRLPPSPFCPLAERVKVTLANGSRSNTSLGSSSSDFLADSVHHNVRNIFVQNLSAQMAFVVDKMSLRHASASLVTFCGKACAYAFMFVPGVADVLVRLWDLSTDLMRRVLHENGIGRFELRPEASNDVVTNFPPALHSLGFTTSAVKYVRKLRNSPPLPVGTQHIEWYGLWTERWSGRESDLFYVFAKHFYILATDFLPTDSTKKERMSAPGFLLVQAQILVNLDATIHRDATSAQQDTTTTVASSTFDEMLGDPDAIASTLPIPPTNATRLMAENRMIMLIRDFLSERTADHPTAREVFAQSFNDLLQAAARGTSLFDHSACYTLLDFLEEAMVILIRYEHLRDAEGALLDMGFWQEVCRKMIQSENTMTEIRLYAFLYTVWHNLAASTQRTTNLCMDLLLERDVFESRFNHWCPMVRAYYMRLLCWRISRHDSEDDDDDVRVLETLQDRLQETWSHYLFLRNQADREQLVPPDTSPCHPAPGRRLLIVRTDNQITAGGSFLTFDGLLKDVPTGLQRPPIRRNPSSSSLLDSTDSRPQSSSSNMDSESDSREKGIGGFLRKIVGASRNRSKSRELSKAANTSDKTPPVPGTAAQLTRAATDEARSPAAVDIPAKAAPHRSLSFRFSLEFQPSNKQHPQMRLLPPRLPPPAQHVLQQKSSKASSVEACMRPVEPSGASVARARYAGRALAEWTVVVGECHSFFERRKNEGVPCDRLVETPTLGVEVFKRPS